MKQLKETHQGRKPWKGTREQTEKLEMHEIFPGWKRNIKKTTKVRMILKN